MSRQTKKPKGLDKAKSNTLGNTEEYPGAPNKVEEIETHASPTDPTNHTGVKPERHKRLEKGRKLRKTEGDKTIIKEQGVRDPRPE